MSHKRTSGAGDGGRAQRAQEIALFRYALIRPVADPALTARERGPLVRELSEQEHQGPFGDRVRVSRVTLTGGSAPGASAGSTPWFLRPGTPSPTRRRRCWSWRRR